MFLGVRSGDSDISRRGEAWLLPGVSVCWIGVRGVPAGGSVPPSWVSGTIVCPVEAGVGSRWLFCWLPVLFALVWFWALGGSGFLAPGLVWG